MRVGYRLLLDSFPRNFKDHELCMFEKNYIGSEFVCNSQPRQLPYAISL